MKKLKIEINKHTFIISVLKVEYQVFLVSLISNFFTNKISLANKWMSFSSSNLALECPYFFEARAEIQKHFCSFFGANENFEIN